MPLPSQTCLLELLSYNPNTGNLYWRERPLSSFKCARTGASWNTRYANQQAFTAIDAKGYCVGAINGTNYRASRVIFKMVHGVEPDQVDHINGDRKDNRITNLRNVSSADNQKNMKRPVNNTSGHIGVIWDESRKKWQASIKVDSKKIHLGRFINYFDAVNARLDAEKKYNFHPNHGR